jgi:cell division protein FtsZ
MKPRKKIKIIGVGGSGSNTIVRMKKKRMEGVELISINTDVQDLRAKAADKKIQIGPVITGGLGAGMDPSVGQAAAEESKNLIEKAVSGADMIFIACGLGGGSGTGAAPVIARLAKSMGILTVAAVTTPFSFEGEPRARIASLGLEKLKPEVDTLLIVPNDKLLDSIDDKTSLANAFDLCDQALHNAIKGITDLIVSSGEINVDFADIHSVIKRAGSAMFGIGEAHGRNRALRAIKAALNSSLLDFSLKEARSVILNVASNGDLSLEEVRQTTDWVRQEVKPSTNLIFGTSLDRRLKPGTIKVTIIATGIN